MKLATTVRSLLTVMGTAALVHGVDPTCLATGTNTLAAAGKALFQGKCAGCHTIGGGKLVGPDLKGVTTTRDHEWFERFISAPR